MTVIETPLIETPTPLLSRCATAVSQADRVSSATPAKACGHFPMSANEMVEPSPSSIRESAAVGPATKCVAMCTTWGWRASAACRRATVNRSSRSLRPGAAEPGIPASSSATKSSRLNGGCALVTPKPTALHTAGGVSSRAPLLSGVIRTLR